MDDVFTYVSTAITLILCSLLVYGAFASLLHLTRQHADAFMVSDKLTKPAWAGILGSILVIGSIMEALLIYNCLIMVNVLSQRMEFSLDRYFLNAYLVLIAAIGVLVYWVDVRPSLDNIRRK